MRLKLFSIPFSRQPPNHFDYTDDLRFSFSTNPQCNRGLSSNKRPVVGGYRVTFYDELSASNPKGQIDGACAVDISVIRLVSSLLRKARKVPQKYRLRKRNSKSMDLRDILLMYTSLNTKYK